VVLVPLVLLSRDAARAWQSDLELWTAAVEAAPASARAWTGLSRVRRIAGDLDQALDAADRAVVLDPHFLRARVTRAFALLRAGKVPAARAELRRIDDLGGGAQRGMNRARRCSALAPADAATCIDEASAVSLSEGPE
jgi:tetratricopeptide (TPR) repeat protein